MIRLDSPRVWRRDSKVPHKLKGNEDVCEYCGLTAMHILQERLGCIKALQPKLPQPPPQKRRDGRCWIRR